MTSQAPQGTEWEEHLFKAAGYLSNFLQKKVLSVPLVERVLTSTTQQ